MSVIYRKYFKDNDGSYRQVVIDGNNAKHEVYIIKTGYMHTTWDLPIEKTMFKTIESLISTCKTNEYTLVK